LQCSSLPEEDGIGTDPDHFTAQEIKEAKMEAYD